MRSLQKCILLVSLAFLLEGCTFNYLLVKPDSLTHAEQMTHPQGAPTKLGIVANPGKDFDAFVRWQTEHKALNYSVVLRGYEEVDGYGALVGDVILANGKSSPITIYSAGGNKIVVVGKASWLLNSGWMANVITDADIRKQLQKRFKVNKSAFDWAAHELSRTFAYRYGVTNTEKWSVGSFVKPNGEEFKIVVHDIGDALRDRGINFFPYHDAYANYTCRHSDCEDYIYLGGGHPDSMVLGVDNNDREQIPKISAAIRKGLPPMVADDVFFEGTLDKQAGIITLTAIHSLYLTRSIEASYNSFQKNYTVKGETYGAGPLRSADTALWAALPALTSKSPAHWKSHKLISPITFRNRNDELVRAGHSRSSAPQTAPAPAPAAQPKGDVAERLKKLKKMYKQGLISKEVYDKKMEKLVDEM